MTANTKRIQKAYEACYSLCNRYHATEFLERALDSARKGERGHRAMGNRFTRGQASYRIPVADAARYFAVKWFLDNEFQCSSFDCAVSLREDALYALGARDRVLATEGTAELMLALRDTFADVLAIDYAKDIAA